MYGKQEICDEVKRFQEYLRIATVQPDVDYTDCVKFLQEQASSLGLPVAVYEFVPKKPVVVITWEGLEPDLPSILLNSHTDVVPVYEEFWTYPPFEARIGDNGCIYARGAQDMKSVGMMHLEAIRRLKNSGKRLRRTVHISFVPDEEIGGQDGMKKFAASDELKHMNVGFELDESGPAPRKNEVVVFNGERTCRQIKITCKGIPGHGSFLIPNTAGEKLHYVIDKFMKLRQEETIKLESKSINGLSSTENNGTITTINLTKIEGGVQVNVVPERLTVYFDIRIAPDVDHEEFDNNIKRWCTEAGDGVEYEYLVKNPQVKNTEIDNCPFYGALEKAIRDMGITLTNVICPGTTDARFLREQGIPAINFSPILNTPMLIHGHDERIHIDEFMRGIEIMTEVVEAIANVEVET